MSKKKKQTEKDVTVNISVKVPAGTRKVKNTIETEIEPEEKNGGIKVRWADDQAPEVNDDDLNMDKVMLIVDLIMEIANGKLQEKAG